jgi:hypothetical protein
MSPTSSRNSVPWCARLEELAEPHRFANSLDAVYDHTVRFVGEFDPDQMNRLLTETGTLGGNPTLPITEEQKLAYVRSVHAVVSRYDRLAPRLAAAGLGGDTAFAEAQGRMWSERLEILMTAEARRAEAKLTERRRIVLQPEKRDYISLTDLAVYMLPTIVAVGLAIFMLGRIVSQKDSQRRS